MYKVQLITALLSGLPVFFLGAAAAAEGRPEPGTEGPASAQADPGPLVQEVDLDVPVERVWNVFTTDEGMTALGVAKAHIDFRVGGKMQSHYDPKGVLGDEGTIEQTIIAYEPMRMVAFRISRPPQGFPFAEAWKGTWTVASMTSLGAGRTHLRLATMGYTADDQSQKMRAFFDQGNSYVMRILKQRLEGTDGKSAGLTGASPDAASTGGVPDSLAPITAEAVVAAPVTEVWKCWTSSEGIRSFLTEANVELRVGGPFELFFDGDAPAGQRGSEGCTILSYEPPNMLSFSWNAPPKFEHARARHTWVVLHLEPKGAHDCRVTLKQLGFAEQAAVDPARTAEWAGVRRYFQQAWPSVLMALREHFEAPAKP